MTEARSAGVACGAGARLVRVIAVVALAAMLPGHAPRAQEKAAEPRAQENAAGAAPAAAAPVDTDALVARVALYPDPLLALVLQASTLPIEVVQATRFLEKRAKDPSLKPDPGWDSSTVGLLNYPTVLQVMNDDLEWTEALGVAVVNRLPGVQASVQQVRSELQAAGVLTSNDKQKVTVDEDTIRIEPATRDVIYVPIYTPVPEAASAVPAPAAEPLPLASAAPATPAPVEAAPATYAEPAPVAAAPTAY